ncbi:MAG: TVP38/TMEM64 family protein [Bacteroidota bacterium]
MNLSRYGRYLRPLGIVLLAVLVSLFILKEGPPELLRISQRYHDLAIVVSLAVYALLGATLVPSEPLTLLLVTLYGPLLTLVLATVGNTLAALVEFLIGKNMGDLAEFERRKAQLPFRLGEIPIRSPVFLLLARMLPGFGPKFVSLACGVYGVPLSTYTWTTIVSNLIGAALVVSGGYGVMRLL